MKIFKKILIPLVLIVAIPFLMVIFSKKSYKIEKEIVIYKPKSVVFEYVKFLKNQEKFAKWLTTNTSIKSSIKGVDGMVGSIYSWESQDKQGEKGETELKNVIKNQKVQFEVRFELPDESREKSEFNIEAESSNITKLKWVVEGEKGYPMNMMIYFMKYEEVLGEDIQKGLNDIKQQLEKH